MTIAVDLGRMATKQTNKQVIISKNIVFLSLKIDLVLENSADSYEMQQHATFHLDLHCLPKYPLRGFRFSISMRF